MFVAGLEFLHGVQEVLLASFLCSSNSVWKKIALRYSTRTVQLYSPKFFSVAWLFDTAGVKTFAKSTFSPASIRQLSKMPDDSKKSDKHSKRKCDSDSGSSSDTSKKARPEEQSAGDLDFIQGIHNRRTDVCKSVDKSKFNKKRVRVLSDLEDFPDDGMGVVYWMSRDQRVQGEGNLHISVKEMHRCYRAHFSICYIL